MELIKTQYKIHNYKMEEKLQYLEKKLNDLCILIHTEYGAIVIST